MTSPSELIALHAAAQADLDSRVLALGEADLRRPTPCAGWDVGDLLGHQLGQQRGFAAAVADGAAPREAYRPVAYDPTAWRASVERILAVFACSDLERPVTGVELASDPLPTRVAIGAQLVDVVVHHWDLATALEERYRPPEDQLAVVADICARIPDSAGRGAPGAAFAPALPRVDDDWQNTLAWIGRDPAWGATG